MKVINKIEIVKLTPSIIIDSDVSEEKAKWLIISNDECSGDEKGLVTLKLPNDQIIIVKIDDLIRALMNIQISTELKIHIRG